MKAAHANRVIRLAHLSSQLSPITTILPGLGPVLSFSNTLHNQVIVSGAKMKSAILEALASMQIDVCGRSNIASNIALLLWLIRLQNFVVEFFGAAMLKAKMAPAQYLLLRHSLVACAFTVACQLSHS